MSRVYFVVAIVAATLIPQTVNGQLFRRNQARQQRIFRNFSPQQRSPLFQNQQGVFQQQNRAFNQQRSNNPQSNVVNQLGNQLRLNNQRPGENPGNLQSVMQSLQQLQRTAGLKDGANQNSSLRQILQSQLGNTKVRQVESPLLPANGQNRTARIIQPVLRGSAPKSPGPAKSFSILETPATPRIEKTDSKSKFDELEPILEVPKLDPKPQMLEETKTSLDIIAPPIEPIEVLPNNSILEIVDQPKKSGK